MVVQPMVHRGERPGRSWAAFAPGPPLRERVAAVLDGTLTDAGRRHPGAVTVLDAGCGHRSPLVPFRSRIATLVGVDIHEPEQRLAYLDAFSVVDLCAGECQLPAGIFDVVLSKFTLEHFSAPTVALTHFHHTLRPGGTLVVVTVNRRHPFVAAYLALPAPVRGRLQRTLKASPKDAHVLVGACNDPAAISQALRSAGFEHIELETVGNLARSWSRHRAGRWLGRVGDLVFERSPSRRSTIIARATKAPEPAGAEPIAAPLAAAPGA